MSTAYDELLYPNEPRDQTHPLRLAGLATLYGAASAPFSTCRVLEVGCGNGANLFGMAIAAPDAEFVGIDLAETPIGDGQRIARSLGLTNLRLEVRDLTEANADLGAFDYIIAHGVYAWTAAPVRDGLMALAGRLLSSRGLAFISYNAMPGAHLRLVLRDLLLSLPGVREGDFADRIATAKAMLERCVALWSTEDPLQTALADEARRMLKRSPAVMFHDELGETYAPQFLTDVVRHAASHGLAYLCDAQSSVLDHSSAEGAWAPASIVAAQQHDFVVARAFRQSIFQRAGAERAAGGPDWTALRSLWGWAQLEPTAPKSGVPGARAFITPKAGVLETAHPQLCGLLDALANAYPCATPLGPWLTDANVGEAALKMLRTLLLTVVSEPFAMTTAPGEKPLASRLARWQAAQGQTELTSLNHATVEIADAEALRFITLLDGQHGRAQLAQAMFGEVTPQNLVILDDRLRALAATGLLTEPSTGALS